MLNKLKFLIVILVALFIIADINAQKVKKSKVPDLVKEKLFYLYPQAKRIKWAKDSINYEADFKLDKVDMSILIEANGNLLKTEIAITKENLPKNTLEYLETNFKNKIISKISKMTKNNLITYNVEIEKENYNFDSDGYLNIKGDKQ